MIRKSLLVGTKCEQCMKKMAVGHVDGEPLLICVALNEFRLGVVESCWARETSTRVWVNTLRSMAEYSCKKGGKKSTPVEVSNLLRRAEIKLSKEMSKEAIEAFREDSRRRSNKPGGGEKNERSAKKHKGRAMVIPWGE